MARLPEIKLNKETIGFAVGLIGLVTTVISGYNWLLDGRAENAPVVKEMNVTITQDRKAQALKDQEQDTRLDRTDRDRDRNTEALKEQTTETQKLKEAVVRLTTVLEQNVPPQPTKKAEWQIPSSYPTRQAANIEVSR